MNDYLKIRKYERLPPELQHLSAEEKHKICVNNYAKNNSKKDKCTIKIQNNIEKLIEKAITRMEMKIVKNKDKTMFIKKCSKGYHKNGDENLKKQR